MLPLRVVLNRVYLYLVAGRDAEQRQELDEQLYAPAGGWEALEQDLWRRLDRAVMDDGGYSDNTS